MVAFMDTHRDEYGVGPTCAVLPIAPSTYYEAKVQQADPTQPINEFETPDDRDLQIRCTDQAGGPL